MTTLMKTQLNNMNEASQRAGGLGTRLDAMEYGATLVAPSAGTLTANLPVVSYEFAPYIGTATKCHAAITLTDAIQTITTAITNPDFPRILSVKGNDANVAGDVVIVGTDINDDALTETIALNAATEVFGVKAFKTVTSIQVPVYDTAGTETVSIGMGDKFGFPIAIPNASLVLAKSFDGAVDTGTVTASATVPASVFAPAGTVNGTKIVKLWFLSI